MAKTKPFSTPPYSVFKSLHREFVKGCDYSVKIPFTKYCKDRFIGRSQGKVFIRKGWLLVTKSGRNLWVEEVCKDDIDKYLGIT